MDNAKLAAVMYIAAGIFFLFSGFIGGNIMYLPLGIVIIILGLRKLKNGQNQ